MEAMFLVKLVKELVCLGWCERSAATAVRQWRPMVLELRRWEEDEDFAALWIAQELDSLSARSGA